MAKEASLDRWIKSLKKLSALSGLLAGAGLVLFYFLGVALYSTYKIVLGIPPSEFSLQKCLEYGAQTVSILLPLLPVYVGLGISEMFHQDKAWIWIFWLYFIPFMMMTILRLLRGRTDPWGIHGRITVHYLVMGYILINIYFLYLFLISTFGTNNLLLNPDVNILIENRQTLQSEMSEKQLANIGLPHMDLGTANIVTQDQEWIQRKIGVMYFLAALIMLYALYYFLSSRELIACFIATGQPRPKWFCRIRYGFEAVCLAYLLVVLFVAPARSVVLSGMAGDKVIVSIKGYENVTSKYYLVKVGEYEKIYAFYMPNFQSVILVEKGKIDSLVLLNPISLFDDRRLFLRP